MRHCAQDDLSIVYGSSSSVPVTCSVTVGIFFALAQRKKESPQLAQSANNMLHTIKGVHIEDMYSCMMYDRPCPSIEGVV